MSRVTPLWGHWLPIPVYVGIVLAVSALFVPRAPFSVNDKLIHAFEFAGLGVLVARALIAQFPQSRPLGHAFTAALFCLGCGALDEWVQSYQPLRNSDFHDLMADAIGGLLGALFVYAGHTVRRRSLEASSSPTDVADADH